MELYHQIKINLSYDDHYVDGNYDDYSKLNELLMSWVKKEKPASYRLLNAQTLFIEEVKEGWFTSPPIIQQILHIAYTMKGK